MGNELLSWRLQLKKAYIFFISGWTSLLSLIIANHNGIRVNHGGISTPIKDP